MTTFRSFGEYGAALHGLADDMAHGMHQTFDEIADRAQRIAIAQAARDLGGDPMFSGWRPMLELDKRTTDVEASIFPTSSSGKWTVAESGRHSGSATHGGKRWNGRTRGKGTATKALAEMQKVLPPMVEQGVAKTIAKRFD
jgi:hypothetical protein